MINQHKNGQKLIGELQVILNELERFASTVDQYVITSSTDLEGNITSVSEAFSNISGYQEEELIGKKHDILKHPDVDEEVYATLWKTISSGDTWHGELHNLNKSGHSYWVDATIEPSINEKAEMVGYIAIQQDITDKKRIEELTITDDLTGVYNRRHFDQSLRREMDRARRTKQYLCMLMIDADNFKKYNDTYGHQAGDWVLKGIAKQMKSTFKRAGDMSFRLGGEEFAVLFHVEEKALAIKISNLFREGIFDNNIEHSRNTPHQRLTISGGLMILEPNKVYIEEEIYKYADEALYRAKNNGRNRIEIHQEGEVEFF
jgi:diguanylate cyclase (GGDEF)-like protein/PAS domain S-box-containing protein